ncbi:uncharacterized protein si:ch211-286b4.4 [Trichomycterus rosablanca]|uniref:uncharacterized protein si:ch211-286b4.4 n=1 Tax=Trichomycterus rosablanca TaxID=2290929 RepID=UPI002F358E9B
MKLFQLSFSEEQQECEADEQSSQVSFGSLVEDFLRVKIPPETQFSKTLLAERLQKYKYFKLEQLLQELEPSPANRPTLSPAQTIHGVPVQEQESKPKQHPLEQSLNEMKDCQFKFTAAQTAGRHDDRTSAATERRRDDRTASEHAHEQTDLQGEMSENTASKRRQEEEELP